VIGNTRYSDSSSPIPTALGEARFIAEELRRADLEVDEKENPNRETMRRAIDAFLAKIQPDSVALLYFSGSVFNPRVKATSSRLTPNMVGAGRRTRWRRP
jgi:uncharacterized caspase-like protein